MVDTINPNTNQPDTFVPPKQPEPPVADGSEHFYGGFDRPDEVKINLAGEPASSFPAVEQAGATQASQTALNATGPNVADVTPVTPPPFEPSETQLHGSYASKGPVNARGLLVIAGIAVVATLIAGFSAYFIVGSMGSSSAKTLQTQITDLNKQLATLKEQPASLSPATTDNTQTEDTTTTDNSATTEVTPTPTPVEVTAPSLPASTDDNSRTSAG